MQKIFDTLLTLTKYSKANNNSYQNKVINIDALTDIFFCFN